MQSQHKIKPKYIKAFYRFFSWSAFLPITFVILYNCSGIAHASLISFIDSILGSEQAAAKTPQKYIASSELAYLTYATNIDPHPVLAQVAPISGGETLMADMAATNAQETDLNTKISTYVVRSGDTISDVAKMFNVSTNTILWANDLTGKSVLRTGQTLIILPVTGIVYTVKSGDSVQAIANKYNADPSDIYNYNDITPSSRLTIGQTLLIPDAEFSAPKTTGSNIKVAPYEPLIGNISNLPSYPEYYACPVIGRISQGLHGHNAVDIAAAVGTNIHASAAGTVIISKSNGAYNGGYGNFVVISHSNGTQTLYAHMSKTSVNVGTEVSKGQVIGYIGMTGLTTGPHTHFEIRGAKNPWGSMSEGSACK